MAEQNDLRRYERQMLLSEIGSAGQALLTNAKVLVIGAGGLGCPALQYLVAAGVGSIGIADGDVVELSNLHRQPLYDHRDIGQPKAAIAKQKLLEQNPACSIEAYPFFLTAGNAWDTIALYNYVLDGSDNFSTRYLVNDICVLQRKPLVYGAIHQFEGQVAVFNKWNEAEGLAANYRDIFPNPPKAGTIANCSTAGVLGILPGLIGIMQATEIIKLITGIGTPLSNKIFNYNALNNQSIVIDINPTIEGRNAVPHNRQAIETKDYNITCDMPGNNSIKEINAAEFEALRTSPHYTIVDVRERTETPELTQFEHIKIPLSELNNDNTVALKTDLIFICQTGARSKKAAQWARQQSGVGTVYSLQGGIIAWLKQLDLKIETSS